MSIRIRTHLLLVLAAVLTVVVVSFAQHPTSASSDCPPGAEPPDSVAAAARRNKARNKGHASQLVSEENLNRTAGPLPPLNMEGPEDGSDFIAALTDYKKSHARTGRGCGTAMVRLL